VPDARGTFPGTSNQLGNFIASYNLVLQTKIAAASNENYSLALAGVAVTAALVIARAHGAWPREARRDRSDGETGLGGAGRRQRDQARRNRRRPLARTSIFSDGMPSSISNRGTTARA